MGFGVGGRNLPRTLHGQRTNPLLYYFIYASLSHTSLPLKQKSTMTYSWFYLFVFHIALSSFLHGKIRSIPMMMIMMMMMATTIPTHAFSKNRLVKDSPDACFCRRVSVWTKLIYCNNRGTGGPTALTTTWHACRSVLALGKPSKGLQGKRLHGRADARTLL